MAWWEWVGIGVVVIGSLVVETFRCNWCGRLHFDGRRFCFDRHKSGWYFE